MIEVSQSSLSFILQVMPSMISLENQQIPGDIDGGRDFQINWAQEVKNEQTNIYCKMVKNHRISQEKIQLK